MLHIYVHYRCVLVASAQFIFCSFSFSQVWSSISLQFLGCCLLYSLLLQLQFFHGASELFSLWSYDDTLLHFSVDSAPPVNCVSVTLLKQRDMEENAASTRCWIEPFLHTNISHWQNSCALILSFKFIFWCRSRCQILAVLLWSKTFFFLFFSFSLVSQDIKT